MYISSDVMAVMLAVRGACITAGLGNKRMPKSGENAERARKTLGVL